MFAGQSLLAVLTVGLVAAYLLQAAAAEEVPPIFIHFCLSCCRPSLSLALAHLRTVVPLPGLASRKSRDHGDHLLAGFLCHMLDHYHWCDCDPMLYGSARQEVSPPHLHIWRLVYAHILLTLSTPLLSSHTMHSSATVTALLLYNLCTFILLVGFWYTTHVTFFREEFPEVGASRELTVALSMQN